MALETLERHQKRALLDFARSVLEALRTLVSELEKSPDK